MNSTEEEGLVRATGKRSAAPRRFFVYLSGRLRRTSEPFVSKLRTSRSRFQVFCLPYNLRIS